MKRNNLGNVMEDREYTPQEARALVLKRARERIEQGLANLQKAETMGKSLFGLPTATPSQKQVTDGDAVRQQVPGRSVFKMLAARKAEKLAAPQPAQKSEVFISTENGADPKKRYVTKGKEGVLPEDAKSKKVENEGSGGILKKDEVAQAKETKPPKASQGEALKPAGVPADKPGDAPSIPKPPAAPGMKGMTIKSEGAAPRKGVFARLEQKKAGK